MNKMSLEDGGYQVLEAEDGEKAFELVQNNKLDLIISDIRMPKMDGMQLLKAVRSDPKTKDIKMVMLTASKALAGERKNYYDAGADGFLLKPINITELRAEVEKQIGK